MEDNNELLTDHDYDGIQEYDNPLPAWWLWTFFVTIIFGFLYWIHYNFGLAPTQREELKKDLAAIESVRQSQPAVMDNEDELQKLMGSAPVLALGAQTYQAKCSPCHGAELQGVIGPDLVDEYWIHGKGKLSDLTAIIRKGVLEKGMPNWEAQLKDDEIKAVAIFIKSKAGTHPANPKAPQGDKVVQD